VHGKWDNYHMASSPRGRHAQPRARLLGVRLSPTTLALAGLVSVFALAGVLAVRVMSVPAHLRQEGAADPPATVTRHATASAAHARATEARAGRSDERRSPTPSPSTTSAAPQAAARTTAPAPATKPSSARPSPHPSPSSSSGGPLPLPTFTRPAHG